MKPLDIAAELEAYAAHGEATDAPYRHMQAAADLIRRLVAAAEEAVLQAQCKSDGCCDEGTAHAALQRIASGNEHPPAPTPVPQG